MREVAPFHAARRTLIVADLCEHFGPWSPRLSRVLARLVNMYGEPRASLRSAHILKWSAVDPIRLVELDTRSPEKPGSPILKHST